MTVGSSPPGWLPPSPVAAPPEGVTVMVEVAEGGTVVVWVTVTVGVGLAVREAVAEAEAELEAELELELEGEPEAAVTVRLPDPWSAAVCRSFRSQ